MNTANDTIVQNLGDWSIKKKKKKRVGSNAVMPSIPSETNLNTLKYFGVLEKL